MHICISLMIYIQADYQIIFNNQQFIHKMPKSTLHYQMNNIIF